MLLAIVSFEVYVFVAIIAAVSFWPLTLVFSKLIRNRRMVMFSAFVGSLLLSPVLYVGLVSAIYFASIQYPSRTFTPEAWKTFGERVEHDDYIASERHQFSRDLIQRKLLIGKSRQQVVEILGPGRETGDVLVYDLGFVPGHGFDPDFLEVYFENDIVVRVEQRRT